MLVENSVSDDAARHATATPPISLCKADRKPEESMTRDALFLITHM